MSDKTQIIPIVKEAQDTAVFPNMPPDLFDDFITWLYERVDLYSFQRSDVLYKKRMYKQFIKQQPPDKLQYALNFSRYEVKKHGTAESTKG